MEKQTTINGEKIEPNNPTQEVLEKVKKLTYPQDWHSYNLAQTQEKIIAEKLLLELIDSFETQRAKRRGRKGASMKEKIYSMFIYNYSRYSSRRCISELKIAQQRKIIRLVPHFNSVMNYFGDNDMTPVLSQLIRITALPLKNIEKDFSADSSGFSSSLFERWLDIRTQKMSRRRQWKKCHLMIGVKSNIITSVKITDSQENDSPHLKPLAEETNHFFDMEELSADKGYSSRSNIKYVASLGCIPYIPFKSNVSKKSKGSLIWSRMFDYFINNRERFDQSYHKRSNVETTFSMIKRKFGNNLRTKKYNSQINEILMKYLCLNLSILVTESFELGLEIDFNYCAEMFFAHKKN